MTPQRRNTLILGAVAAGAAAAGGLLGALALQGRSAADTLLAAAYPDLSGRQQRLVEWRTGALVCNFWATWCAPCREEMPLFEAAHRKYTAKAVQIVGIAVDNAANVGEFIEKVKVTYPILIAGASAVDLMRDLGNEAGALPFTVLLNRQGRVADRKLGAYTAAQLDAAVAGLVQ